MNCFFGYWIVAEGTAKLIIDDVTGIFSENQSFYILLVALYGMENSDKLPLPLIEVQTGSYFGENEITRQEDIYAHGQCKEA